MYQPASGILFDQDNLTVKHLTKSKQSQKYVLGNA
jgi:hypothetical protein